MSVANPDPERVREARALWADPRVLPGAASREAAGDLMAQVVDVWLAGSSPDYEAATEVVRELLERIPVTLADDVSRDATLWAVQIIHAAFPGLFEERP